MQEHPVPAVTEVGVVTAHDHDTEVELAVPARVLDVAHFGHLRDPLVKREPQPVLIEGAVLARAQGDHHVLVLAEHGGQLGDGLG
ncbi:hypothetical protein FQZ97_976410 [compost metagenome]